MFIVSSEFRASLVKEYGMSAGLTDEQVRKFAADLIQADKLELKTFFQFAKQSAKGSVIDTLTGAKRQPRIESFAPEVITKGMRYVLTQFYRMPSTANDQQAADFLLKLYERQEISLDAIAGIVAKTLSK